MKSLRILAAVVAVSAVVGLSACAPTTPVVAPVTVSVGDLQGATVDVALNQVINIDTGDLAVDSYTAEIADSSILEFVQGKEDGGATFNPGLKPLKEGTTEVTLTNEQGGIQPLVFSVTVKP
ncbi:MAG: hypothetical protein ACKVOG_04020 [Rhodoglobus sp.]